ncbi:MAG: ribonuclease E/G [Magnetococcus sp. MYC-9]
MAKRMLVDATHAEEVRVAVVQDQRLIDLDIETASREQIKGNVYLARVTRVEPSLQAAFVEFHNGRQGFLSVNDIHNKYYPPEEPERDGKGGSAEGGKASASQEAGNPDKESSAVPTDDDDLSDELPPSDELRPRVRRRYLPIQRILNRGQTLLVQVVKEARGTKGASLTTHISLAGRYTVLLPENSGGGGISRKITDPVERKHLKEVLNSMEIPGHVSLIIRTAGLGRTKREVARDMSYLLRLWKMIEEKAKQLKPPALIHEEGDLIIRAIRDLYTTDMEEILIDGPEGYRVGKDFMRLLMPRYVKVVQPYKDSLPLFARYQIENQIESMHERKVPLRAGGYLVIDPTEALVTIDINSGRSTRERDVESTAFKTNLQAAEEIGRQLRLRDLGGLVVIDFIDMDDKKHILEVEKQLKEALKLDRAKIQLGKISSFGLLELSRQRMKPTFNETSRLECPRCKGLGTIRSIESASIHLFRQLEEEVAKERYSRLTYTTSQEIANYLLNNKREQLRNMEAQHDTVILIFGDPSLQTPEFHKNRVERTQEELEAREALRSAAVVVVTEEPEESEELLDDLDDLDDEADEEREGSRSREGGKASPRRGQGAAEAMPRPGGGVDGEEGSGRGDAETADKSRRRRRRRKKPGLLVAPVVVGQETLETPLPAGGEEPPSVPEAEIGKPVAARSRQRRSSAAAAQAPSPSPVSPPVVEEAVVVTHVPGLYVLGNAVKNEENPPWVANDGGLETDALSPAGMESVDRGVEDGEETVVAEDGSTAVPSSRPRRRRRRRRSGAVRPLMGGEGILQQEEGLAIQEDVAPLQPEGPPLAVSVEEEEGGSAGIAGQQPTLCPAPDEGVAETVAAESVVVAEPIAVTESVVAAAEPVAVTESVVAAAEPVAVTGSVVAAAEVVAVAEPLVVAEGILEVADSTDVPVSDEKVPESAPVAAEELPPELPKAKATRARAVRRKVVDPDAPVPEKKPRVYRKRATKGAAEPEGAAVVEPS